MPIHKGEKYYSGSAFQYNHINNTRPLSHIPGRENTKYVRLTEFRQRNFISERIGYQLIKEKKLIGIRRHGQWHVCINPYCYEQLCDRLGVDNLFFDADNGVIS